jgi:hypothetical protein
MGEVVDLRRVRVELVTEMLDIAELETMLSREHPLGWRKAQGKRLYYAVVYEGYWIGALLFDGAVIRNKMRAQEIGWTPQQESERREHICNNSRFLVCSDYQGVPNLASKILSLVEKRIADDWLRRYGVPLLAMETYVDPERNDNQGSCYLAAGWNRLGMSSGYEISKGERTHGKWYFLKPLHDDSYKALRSEIPHALLTGVKSVSGESNNNFVLDASKFRIDELKKALSQVSDPRKRRGMQYRFVPFLALCVAAVVSGYTQYRQIADWIKNLGAPTRARFGLRGDRCPGEGAVGKLLRRIDPEELEKALSNWLFSTYPEIAQGTVLSLDGKALRGTDSDMAKQVSLLNVFANEVGIVIKQLPTTKGSGEKASARAFAEDAENISGKIVMGDAMLTDRKLIELLEKKTPITSLPSKTIIQA